MAQHTFEAPGRFYRGNLHTHSTRSDGSLAPEEVCRRYRDAGYDFIALTDHFMRTYSFPIVDTQPYRHEDFTTIIGAELHTGETEMGSIWHILAVGLPTDFATTPDGETGPELAQRAIEAGAFVAVAHPQWYTLTERDIDELGPVHAIEVWNGVAIDDNDRSDSWHITEIMLGRGKRYFAIATDDFHGTRERNDFSRGWVWVKSETLAPDALLAALKNGHFYSSTGPEIYHVELDRNRQLRVYSSPAERIIASGVAASRVIASGNGIYDVTLDLSRFESPYVRITVRDTQGRRAWTNPIWFD